MNVIQSLKDAWKIVTNDKHTMLKVAHDKDSLGSAVALIIIVGLFTGLLSGLFAGAALGNFVFLLFAMALNPILLLIGTFIGYGATHLLALLFGGKATFRQFYSVAGHTTILSIGTIIPIVSILIWIWNLVIFYFILKNIHQLSTGRAVAVILIPIAIAVIFVAFIFASILSTVGLSGLMPMMGRLY